MKAITIFMFFFILLKSIMGQCPSSFVDSRDNQTYTAVLIGDQCWMSQNLNIGSQISKSIYASNNSIIEKYCFDDLALSCNLYGGLYFPNEFMEYSFIEGSQGICPSGWHLPGTGEWDKLISYLGGYQNAGAELKTGGTSGFNALMSGYLYYNGKHYNKLGKASLLGSSDPSLPISDSEISFSFDKLLYLNESEVYRHENFGITAISVRCIKDDNTAGNQPPNIPKFPDPYIYHNNHPINRVLQWECTDPENDNLTYDIYFGLTNTPPLVSTSISNTSYDPGTLTSNTTYYWQVIASDNLGNNREGPVWEFTTSVNSSTICQSSFIDPRDSKVYTAQMFGDKCWMTKGLNYGAIINGGTHQTNNNITEKYCYEDLSTNCDDYGGLYQWDELMMYDTIEGSQGICPSGWHVPDTNEIKMLESVIGANLLYRFKPLGTYLGYGSNGGYPSNELYNGRSNFWSSSQYDEHKAYYQSFVIRELEGVYNFYKKNGLYLICVKD